MEIQVQNPEETVLDQAMLESIFEGISEGVIFIDSSNKFVYLNRAAREMASNLRAEDGESLIGESVLLCHPSESRHKILEIIDDIRHGRKDFNHTILKVKNRYYDSISSRVVSRDKEYLGVVLVNHDITEKFELQRRLEESNKELLLLQEVNYALNSTISLDEILQLIVRGITDTFGYDYCAVHLLSEDGDALICKNYSSDSKVINKLEKMTGLKAANYRIPLHKGNPLLKIIESGNSWLTHDIIELIRSHTDKELIKSMAPVIARIVRTEAAVGVPLCSGERVVGVLGIGSKKDLGEKDIKRLENFASQVGVAVEKARLYEDIKEKTHALHGVLKGMGEAAALAPEAMQSDRVLKALSNPIRKSIAELLYDRGKTRFTDIKNLLRIKDGTKLSFHLRGLKSEGVVEQDEKKKYTLSNMGRKAVRTLRALER